MRTAQNRFSEPFSTTGVVGCLIENRPTAWLTGARTGITESPRIDVDGIPWVLGHYGRGGHTEGPSPLHGHISVWHAICYGATEKATYGNPQ